MAEAKIPQRPVQRQERGQERNRREASSAPAAIVAEEKARGTSQRKRKREAVGHAAEDV